MKKKIKIQGLTVLFIISAIFVSCNSDDNSSVPPTVTKESFVTEVSGPTEADRNQEVSIEVKFLVENECGSFNKFIEVRDGNTTNIEVEAKYIGTDCDEEPVIKTEVYKFKSLIPGTFDLKFKKDSTEFITHTVVVD